MTKKSPFNVPGIYRIRNIITDTVYVGQAININERWTNEKRALRRNKYDRNQYLQRAWNKYGEANFNFDVAFQFLSTLDRHELDLALDEAEIELLRHYKDNCYNLMEAGISGMVASESTLRKLSEHNKKQWQKPEHRAKISAAQKAAWNEPGRKQERIAQYKEAFQRPEYKARRKQISQDFWAPGGCLRETQSAKRKANWQDPNYIEKQKLSRTRAWQDPTIREKRIAAINKANHDPEVRKRRTEAANAARNTPEYKAKAEERSRKIKEGWARRKALGLKRKPNSPSDILSSSLPAAPHAIS